MKEPARQAFAAASDARAAGGGNAAIAGTLFRASGRSPAWIGKFPGERRNTCIMDALERAGEAHACDARSP